ERGKGQVKVPGFRAGKAPVEMVEKNANQQLLLDEFMDHALNDLLRKAVEGQKLRPVGQPEVTLKKFVPYTELEFEAKLDVLGEVTLPNYKIIKMAKPKVDISAKEVNDVISGLQKRLAERIDVDRPAKLGDEVWIDFAGTDKDGQPVAGADGKDYPLILGSNTFIPGFEDNLIGVKTGESKEFTLTFPKEYGIAALQGKKVTFKTDIKKVQELVEPKVDDEFAKKAGAFTTLKELKDDIKKQVKAEKQLQADRDYENELIKKITDKAKVDIPSALIDNQLVHMEEEEKRNLSYRGITWPEHLAQENVTEEQHRERHRSDAETRVKAGLVLSEISEKEKLDVTPEELEVRIQILKGQYQDPQMQAEIDKPENRQDIAARILTEKTIQKLTSYASK
ncbi:trigger factor, partial [Candidatus Saccharibacteria bacterium]|nr:trigger factor [Candidatus Saccharibacteria bacterium]